MLTGTSLVAGAPATGGMPFENTPVEGQAGRFLGADPATVAKACEAADAAFESFAATSRTERATFLRRIADEIEARGDALTAQGAKETGLPTARLEGERGRTTGQLRLFADHIEAGVHLDARHDAALPNRTPLPRPDLRMVQRPLGPVAVFGASNFPLAFSTAGGDTAAALAAGCPVVVKGHPAHPGVCDLVAQAIDAARVACDLHPGVFSQVQGGDYAVGEALARHLLIKAVAFTGSLRGGRALFEICAARPEPIPFFGELGSINPVFVLDSAAEARGADIATGWAASLSMGMGQFCTKPGVLVLSNEHAEKFLSTAAEALVAAPRHPMLTGGIAQAYGDGIARIAETAGIEVHLTGNASGRDATPALFSTDPETWLSTRALHDEVFGPMGIVVTVASQAERLAVARGLEGQLTATLHMEDADLSIARTLLQVLERKAGRLLANGFPTGVEVADAMVHGGPYPASTNFGHTSVGTLAIRRFLRPVCYQNLPEALLPRDLRGVS